MANTASIRAHMDKCRAKFLAAAGAVPADKWQQVPATGGWSAAEVVAHVTQVERAIGDGARKMLGEEPRHFSYWSRIHPPLRLIQWRGVKRQTPIPLDRALLSPREAMLEQLAAGRAATLAVMEENRDRDLRAWCWRHPFFGPLNFYEWMMTLGHHDLRHAKQIHEIVDSLQE